MAAALVDADQEEFIVSSTIIDVVCPSAEGVRTAFFDMSTDGFKIENPCPARFEGIGGWDVTGVPCRCALRVNRIEHVFEGLLDRPLHGVQIDLTVALNVKIFI